MTEKKLALFMMGVTQMHFMSQGTIKFDGFK